VKKQGTKMSAPNRWNIAQGYEKAWWETRQELVDFDFYRAYAQELIEKTRDFISIQPTTAILEIGSGAGGILTFLDSNDRHAIDPLESFYGSVPTFQQQRDPNVQYKTAQAEDLPFEDNRFDLIICDNVLDHCENVQQVFEEIHRVMRSNSVLYLRVNLYTTWGKLVRFLVEKLKIDPGHPYTFTRRSIRDYFDNHDLEIMFAEQVGFGKAWLKELKSFKPKEMIKALTFSSPNKSLYILKRAESG
jgi:ubiquinone/menaquinone biosynthesis C-methylase UbiE